MAEAITTAMIFAAGLGTRMRPLTDTLPKPLVKVNGKPLIDWRLDKLAEAGVKRVIVNTHYKAELLQQHLRQRKDVDIIFSHEEVLLETGGGLVNALPLLGEKPFYLLNADAIWLDTPLERPALLRLADSWNDTAMDELLLLQPRERAMLYRGEGDFGLDAQGRLERPDAPRPHVFTGVQIFHPAHLAGYKAKPFSRSEVWWNAPRLDGTTLARLYGLVHTGEWINIDSPQDVAGAERYLASPEKSAANNL